MNETLLDKLMNLGMSFSLTHCDKIDAIERDMLNETARLRGEASVMRELLRNCLAVISIAEPLTTDEADALADLNQKIERAIGDAKGTLL